MSRETLSRRAFLKISAVGALGAALAACQPAAPTQPAAPVATAAPTKPAAPAATATPAPMTYKEAPMLADLVKAGKLPPVAERLPQEPMIMQPVEEVGQYGGNQLEIRPNLLVSIYESRWFYSNLIRWDTMGAKSIPNAAKSWEVSSDGKTFTFNLRKGMKWSDGKPWTASTFAFWYEDVLLNKELTPTFPTWLMTAGQPGKIEKVDDYTVRFVFTATNGLFLTLMSSANGVGMMNYCDHYLKQFHVKYADKDKLDALVKEKNFQFWYQLFVNRQSEDANPELPTIFPWNWVEVAPANPKVAARNPYYWKVDTSGNQLPYFDKVSCMGVESQEVFNVKTIAGEADFQSQYVQYKNYPLYEQGKAKGNYRIVQWDRGYITDSVIAVNSTVKDPVKRQYFADKRFRWALSLGIKRDEIIEALYLGQAQPSQVSPLPSSPFYWEPQAKNLIEYDPDRANKLLDEIGLNKKDAEGYRLMSDGKRLTIFSEYYTSGLGPWAELSTLLAAQWKKLGIELGIKGIDNALWYQKAPANDFELTFWTGSGEFNPLIDPRWFLPFSQGSCVQYAAYAQWYNTRGKEGEEPKGDVRTTCDLYDQIQATADADKQKALFRQILELNKENLWAIGICTAPPDIFIAKNTVRNIPAKAISDWQVLTPANTMPEQYFFKK